MACVDWIEKNGKNETQNYRYAMASDIFAAVRGELARRFVLMVPNVTKTDFSEATTKSGGIIRFCTLHVRFDFIDSESGEIQQVNVVGQGMDSGDKCVYKAMTGATKACLVNTFLIPTGDDPENEKTSKPTPPPPAGAEALKQRMRSTPPQASGTGPVFPNYGTAKGQPIRGAALKDLQFYANGCRRTLADTSKANYHNKERAILSAIEAELARQNAGPSEPSSFNDNEPPPPSDEDAPF